MVKNLLFTFSTVALASAFAASSYTVTLFDESVIDGKALKPGQYKLEVTDNGVVLKHNKDVTEVSGKTQVGSRKYGTTAVRYNDKHEVEEIYLGGTNKKIVFGGAQTTANGGI